MAGMGVRGRGDENNQHVTLFGSPCQRWAEEKFSFSQLLNQFYFGILWVPSDDPRPPPRWPFSPHKVIKTALTQ